MSIFNGDLDRPCKTDLPHLVPLPLFRDSSLLSLSVLVAAIAENERYQISLPQRLELSMDIWYLMGSDGMYWEAMVGGWRVSQTSNSRRFLGA